MIPATGVGWGHRESMVPASSMFSFQFFMMGPYFWHLLSSLVNLEAAVAHGLVGNGVDDDSTMEACQHGCGRMRSYG